MPSAAHTPARRAFHRHPPTFSGSATRRAFFTLALSPCPAPVGVRSQMASISARRVVLSIFDRRPPE
jgi:hypothetical protein